MKKELGYFKEEINQKLSEIRMELKNTEARIDDVEKSVSVVEELNANAERRASQTLKRTKTHQVKLDELGRHVLTGIISISGILKGKNSFWRN